MNILTPSKYDKWIDIPRDVQIYVDGIFMFTSFTKRSVDSIRDWVMEMHPYAKVIYVEEN